MTSRWRVLLILGCGVLVLAVLLARLDLPLFGGASPATPPPTRSTPTLVAMPTAVLPLNQRVLALPVLRPDEDCPVSKGSKEAVPEERYIFGAGGLWFGRGPVYFGLSWHDDQGDDATFSLDPVPYQNNAYSAKTPWVSTPRYAGPILVRGRQLDVAEATNLRFSHEGFGPSEALQLDAQGGPGADRWGFWPSSMLVPGPGCYGVQIDTLAGTDLVVFTATRRAAAPGGNTHAVQP